jgi:hypothetical protein
MDIIEVGWGDMGWIDLDQNRDAVAELCYKPEGRRIDSR